MESAKKMIDELFTTPFIAKEGTELRELYGTALLYINTITSYGNVGVSTRKYQHSFICYDPEHLLHLVPYKK